MNALLTGNEALARGAWEAGVRFASAYPGTPSTEILENLTGYTEVFAEWAPNEKTALEAACGASVGGVRALASMKHVGVNVAADALFTFAYTGVGAGMVLVSADEPGQHSSQNEQDNRHYARAAKIPMLEPSNSQECRDMMLAAYEISERFDVPVMLRLTTRVCHSKSIVELGERREPAPRDYQRNPAKYVMVPGNAKVRRVVVEERLDRLQEYAEESPFNRVEEGGRLGVVVSGACYHYAREVFGDEVSYLKLGFTHPLPHRLLDRFCAMVDEIYVIEENDPYLEGWLRERGYACRGKDLFPRYGEMLPEVLRRAVGREELASVDCDTGMVVPRPPTLCAGCPHRGLFVELGRRKNAVFSGDIGCYTLAFSPPYNAMELTVCMGAAFSSGHGLQKAMELAGRDTRVVAVMGDSTFFHTGIPSLTEVLYNGSNTICVILDNRITGMTGHQEHPGTGKTAAGDPATAIDIEGVCRALGAELVQVVNPNDLGAVRAALDAAWQHNGPSVLITRWPCVLKQLSQADREEFGEAPFAGRYRVEEARCVGCKICLRSGCPAVSVDPARRKSSVDAAQCAGCGVCAQLCPKGAITPAVREEVLQK